MFAIYGSTNGGRLVAPELGFDPDQMYMHTETFARSITRAIGDDRLGRFFAMRNHLRLGDYLFVHAGIHPDVGLACLSAIGERYLRARKKKMKTHFGFAALS